MRHITIPWTKGSFFTLAKVEIISFHKWYRWFSLFVLKIFLFYKNYEENLFQALRLFALQRFATNNGLYAEHWRESVKWLPESPVMPENPEMSESPELESKPKVVGLISTHWACFENDDSNTVINN